jgi:Fic family protein
MSCYRKLFIEGKSQLISKPLLLRLHRMVGQNLGEHFAAIPGRFRETEVTVAKYRCPDHRDIPELIQEYCRFMKYEFKYEQGNQAFSEIFLQAIVAHVYLEWIHPFGDGNGRTGRLLEFYILSRGGNPDITLHILSNHYNNPRPEYYRQLDKASKTGDLTDFIAYALLGFRDGLKITLEKIQMSQLHTTWQKFVYDTFKDVPMGHRETFVRRRTLGLEIPVDQKFKITEIQDLNIPLAKLYSGVSERTLARDIDELVNLRIIVRQGKEIFANIMALNRMFARRKGLLAGKLPFLNLPSSEQKEE